MTSRYSCLASYLRGVSRANDAAIGKLVAISAATLGAKRIGRGLYSIRGEHYGSARMVALAMQRKPDTLKENAPSP